PQLGHKNWVGEGRLLRKLRANRSCTAVDGDRAVLEKCGGVRRSNRPVIDLEIWQSKRLFDFAYHERAQIQRKAGRLSLSIGVGHWDRCVPISYCYGARIFNLLSVGPRSSALAAWKPATMAAEITAIPFSKPGMTAFPQTLQPGEPVYAGLNSRWQVLSLP